MALADLYDTFEMIKAQKLVKDYEKAHERRFSKSLARKVELYLAYTKEEKLIAQEEKRIKVKCDLSLEEISTLDELASDLKSQRSH